MRLHFPEFFGDKEDPEIPDHDKRMATERLRRTLKSTGSPRLASRLSEIVRKRPQFRLKEDLETVAPILRRAALEWKADPSAVLQYSSDLIFLHISDGEIDNAIQIAREASQDSVLSGGEYILASLKARNAHAFLRLAQVAIDLGFSENANDRAKLLAEEFLSLRTEGQNAVATESQAEIICMTAANEAVALVLSGDLAKPWMLLETLRVQQQTMQRDVPDLTLLFPVFRTPMPVVILQEGVKLAWFSVVLKAFLQLRDPDCVPVPESTRSALRDMRDDVRVSSPLRMAVDEMIQAIGPTTHLDSHGDRVV